MNLPTLLVAGVVALAFAAIVITAVRNHKRGKHACACGGDCANCSHCHH